MLFIPLQPLGEADKRAVALAAKMASPGSGEWFRAMSCLWLHFCLLEGIPPSSTKPGGPRHRTIAGLWTPAAAKITGNCSNALGLNWAGRVATYAAGLHQEATGARSAAAVSTPSLFEAE